MKWLRIIQGVAENVVSMFRQVDVLLQRVHSRQYSVKIKKSGNIYTVNVVDLEGNAVDSIVIVYSSDSNGGGVIGATVDYGWPTASIPSGARKLLSSATNVSHIMRCPKSGLKLTCSDSRATIRACVLGKEVTV